MIISAKKLKPYFKVFLILAFLSSAGYVFWFLTNFFYPTITGSQTISTLRKNMAAEAINLAEFEALLNKINEKTKAPPESGAISDPFH
jgi:hypothetical protein